MKKAVLLRQKVPEDVERITFQEYKDIDDVWMQLFYTTCKRLGIERIESWNWGGFRYNYLLNDFLERWFYSFRDCHENVKDAPDLIFARGGFPEYIQVMQCFPRAFKIYYGAGKRYNPRAVPDLTKYDLVLVDTYAQKVEVRRKGYKAATFIKPACEHVFRDVAASKKYDVVFIANAPQKKLKGHKWLFDRLKGSDLSILQIGYNDKEVMNWAKENKLKITFTGWMPRRDIPYHACRARVGVVASTDYESCPRVIPEYLAMNLPIVVKDTTRVSDLYVNEHTGFFANDNIVTVIRKMLDNYSEFAPYWYYQKYLSVDKAANHLVEIMDEAK